MMHKIKLIPTQLMQICHTSYQHLHQWLNIYVQHHHHQQFPGQTKATEQLQSPNPKEIHPDPTSIAIKTITAPVQAVQNFKVDRNYKNLRINSSDVWPKMNTQLILKYVVCFIYSIYKLISGSIAEHKSRNIRNNEKRYSSYGLFQQCYARLSI